MIRNTAETDSQTGSPDMILMPRFVLEWMLGQMEALTRMEAMIQRLHEDHLQAQAQRASIMGFAKRWATEKTMLILGILGLMMLSLPAKDIGAVLKAVLTAALGLM